MLVLPALAALPAVNGKLTALADNPRVSDSFSVAFSAMICAPELSTWADAKDSASTVKHASMAASIAYFFSDCIEYFSREFINIFLLEFLIFYFGTTAAKVEKFSITFAAYLLTTPSKPEATE